MTVMEQERVAKETVTRNDELRRELDSAATIIRKKDNEIADLQSRLDECLSKLQESRNKIKDNESSTKLDKNARQ